ncbi:Rho termination factor N-terminal domain-containing protein [Microbacterium fluvii]|uniref:Rho termination factor N-terminal domain-containing protein n=1 Tax=Microbacterium fluvii TaxID=415215 RepID=A0ABW2HJR8_9MICO|nr:Rho termination factor N-terminal domain-containing protein [Microbacterium fluvii]MCU4673889.1 Rho termination factor N-terminal domain-containing protein [Microbacterium fluvii]
MPRGRGSGSLKNPELYEELRNEGASKEKAARISNAIANEGASAVGRRGGKAGDYEDWTVDQLRSRARELGLSGYSGKRKAQLIDMLRTH